MMEQDAQQQMVQLQQQLQSVMMQKENMKNERNEIDKALSELEDAEDQALYKSVGTVLISRDRGELVDELEEDREALDVKIQSLQRKENQLKEKFQESQQQLSGDMGGLSG